MRLYRYCWSHAHRNFAHGVISLQLYAPSLGLRAEISRYQKGWYHWLQIRRENDDWPLVQCSGPVPFVFKVIRETVKQELERRLT